MKEREKWLELAIEVQSLAQNGLAYTEGVYDRERYERLREIATEMIAIHTDLSFDKIKNLFCNEVGYQTPKLETRAVIIKDDKILLVQENNGMWAMPGGWVDVLETIGSNTKKEAKEEAGLDVEPKRIIAIQDKNKHNTPNYVYGICKVFVLCDEIGGSFQKNSETLDSGYFTLDNLPPLAEDKCTKQQIEMCLKANKDNNWKVVFD